MHKSGWDRQWWCADLGLFPSRPQARDGLLHCDYLVARKKKMEKIKDVRPNRKEVAERDENNSIFSFVSRSIPKWTTPLPVLSRPTYSPVCLHNMQACPVLTCVTLWPANKVRENGVRYVSLVEQCREQKREGVIFYSPVNYWRNERTRVSVIVRGHSGTSDEEKEPATLLTGVGGWTWTKKEIV